MPFRRVTKILALPSLLSMNFYQFFEFLKDIAWRLYRNSETPLSMLEYDAVSGLRLNCLKAPRCPLVDNTTELSACIFLAGPPTDSKMLTLETTMESTDRDGN